MSGGVATGRLNYTRRMSNGKLGASEQMTINEFLLSTATTNAKYVVIGAGWLGVRAVRAIEAACHAEIVVLQVGVK